MSIISSLPLAIPAHERHVRRARAADLAPMAHTLAAALRDDPAAAWLVPDAARRRAVLPALTELLAEHGQPHGENHTNESGTGAALWLPPEATAASSPAAAERLACGVAMLAGEAGLARWRQLCRALAAVRPAEPHYHLALHGVMPGHQGAGIGAALLHAVLDRADRDRLPAALVATSPRSRHLYERHGFEMTAGIRCPGGPPLWAMWRAPQPW